jgi:transposase
MNKYIGIDAHSSSCSFCVMDEQGRIIDESQLETNGRVLINYLRSLGGKCHIAFEECEISSWLHTILQPEADKVIVCNPVVNSQYKKNKTDKLDARHLAKLLRGGFLSEVYHDGSARENLRVMVSAYQDIVEEGVRLKNRYKSLFRRRGQRVVGKTIYNDESLLNDLKRPDFRFVGKQLYRQLEQLEAIRKEYLKEMLKLTKKFNELRYLKSIPGIGDIHAAKIISQVVNPVRFQNKYKFYGYCGLARHKRMSAGEDHGSSRIRGNTILKCTYKMAAYSALQGSHGLRKYYDRLMSGGTAHKHAVNAVARKIAAISLAVWRKKEKYNDKLLTEDLIK